MEQRDENLSDASWLVAGGRPIEPGQPLNTPLVPASNFTLDSGGSGTSYARGDTTPTWQALETLLGGLEDATSVCFASGMAAMAAVFELLPAGAAVFIPDDCYHGVAELAEAGAANDRWTLKRLATADTGAWLAAAAEADLLWLESPSNPLLEVADVAGIGAADRKPGSLLVVDNTFATPINQRPLDLGADVSVQSVTKFVGGHSDLLGGVASARRPELIEQLNRVRAHHGATPGALESFLALRGIRTLTLRLERSQATAGVLARRLTDHPGIERVRYPGLAEHPGHELAAAQLNGFGSVLSFDVAGGAEAADELCRRIRLIRHATSLGGVESTMERRGAISGQEHLPPGLVRLSVGIEDVEDLWADLEQGLPHP